MDLLWFGGIVAFIGVFIWYMKHMEEVGMRETNEINNRPVNKRRRLERELVVMQKDASHLQEQIEELLSLEFKGTNDESISVQTRDD